MVNENATNYKIEIKLNLKNLELYFKIEFKKKLELNFFKIPPGDLLAFTRTSPVNTRVSSINLTSINLPGGQFKSSLAEFLNLKHCCGICALEAGVPALPRHLLVI